jgi:hypothetical protein
MADRVVIGDYVRINDTFADDPTMIGKTGTVRLILMPENHPGVELDVSPFIVVLAHHSELDIIPKPVTPDF